MASEEESSVEDVEEQEANLRAFASMRLAETLRYDIMPIASLVCAGSKAACHDACPCFATLHPFCDLFHTWLCHRIIDDGADCSRLLPNQVIEDTGGVEGSREAMMTELAAMQAVTGGDGSPEARSAAAAAAAAERRCDVMRFDSASSDEDEDEEGEEGEDEDDEDEDEEGEGGGDGAANAEGAGGGQEGVEATREARGGASASASCAEEKEEEEEEEEKEEEDQQVLCDTASHMVRTLEQNVGDARAQREQLVEQLSGAGRGEGVSLTADGACLALEEILEWYSVLSILACSFPTQR
jgi:hypothetical protein